MRYLIVLFVLLATAVNASAQGVLLRLLGVRPPKAKTHEAIVKHIQQITGNSGCIYEADTLYYKYLLSRFDSSTIAGRKKVSSYLQPVQAIYFDNQTGKMVASLANCDADVAGFPFKLSWAQGERMTTFPPRHTFFIDSSFQLASALASLSSIATCNPLKPATYDYTVLIFWAEFIGKNHERLLKEVHQNLQAAGDKTVLPIYISLDNFYAQYARLSD